MCIRDSAYPFAFSDDWSTVVAAISYPYRTDNEDCDCHYGGRILAFADNHSFETSTIIPIIDPADHRFMVNTLLALARVTGDSLDACETPPGVPHIDSIPCGNPGESIIITGSGFTSDMTLTIGGDVVSFTWLDSSQIQIVIPSSLVQGYYQVQVITAEGVPSNIAILQVYCEWEVIIDIAPFCVGVMETLWIYGMNFSPSASIFLDGIPLIDYDIVSDSVIWVVMPDTTGLPEGPLYTLRVENSPTQYAERWVQYPCPPCADADTNYQITNLHFWEKTDGSDTVFIVYDLIAPEAVGVVISASTDGGDTWDVTLEHITGAFGDGIAPGESLVIIWFAGEDAPGIEMSDLLFRINVAEEGGIGGDTIGQSEYYVCGKLSFGGSGVCIYPIDTINVYVDWNNDEVIDSILTDIHEYCSLSGSELQNGTKISIIGKCILYFSQYTVSDGGAYEGAEMNWAMFPIKDWDSVYIIPSKIREAHIYSNESITIYIDYDFDDSPDEIHSISPSSEFVLDSTGVFPARIWGTGKFEVVMLDYNDSHYGNTDGISLIPESALSNHYVVPKRTHQLFGDENPQYDSSFVYILSNTNANNIDYQSVDIDTSLFLNEGEFAIIYDSTEAIINGSNNYLCYRKTEIIGWDDWRDVYRRYNTASIIHGINRVGYIYKWTNLATTSHGYPKDELAISSYLDDNHVSLDICDDGSIEYEAVLSTDTVIYFTETSFDFSSCYSKFISTKGVNILYNYSKWWSSSIEELRNTPLYPTFPDPCIFGAVYTSAISQGPLDTWSPRVNLICPPGPFNVGDITTLNWSVEDSFVPPNALTPLYPITIYFSDDGTSFYTISAGELNDGTADIVIPSVLTSNGYFALCVTDSFGHTSCDTCGPFTIVGDTTRPYGYAYADTCWPDTVYFVLHDDVGIDPSGIMITAPDGVHFWGDPNIFWLDDTTLVYLPPDETGYDTETWYSVYLFGAVDSSGNMLSGEMGVHFHICEEVCTVSIDSVWFSEETDCNDSNIVEICYILSSTCPDSLFNVNVRMRPDASSGWMSAGDGWFSTLTDTAGDFGAAVDTGMHCFNWIMNEDTAAEGREWEVVVTSLFLSTFEVIDSFPLDNSHGIAFDGENLVIAHNDPLNTISFIQNDYPYSVVRSITLSGISGIEDLEYVDGHLYGNITFSSSVHRLCEIDIYTGDIIRSGSDMHSNYISGLAFDGSVFWGGRRLSNHLAYATISSLTPIDFCDIDLEPGGDYWLEGMTWFMYKLWAVGDGTDGGGKLYVLDVGSCTLIDVLDIPFGFYYGPEGLGNDGHHLWYANQSTDHVYKLAVFESNSADTALDPLDSRPPSVHLLCPGDSAISAGDIVHLEWSVVDTFWNDDPCSLHIYGIGCSYDTTIIVPDTFYDWIVPSATAECDTVWFVVTVRDSFCNWGKDSCAIPPVCRPAWVWIECAPCGGYTGCYDQIVRWGMWDLDDIPIALDSTYFTVIITHSDMTWLL